MRAFRSIPISEEQNNQIQKSEKNKQKRDEPSLFNQTMVIASVIELKKLEKLYYTQHKSMLKQENFHSGIKTPPSSLD